MNHHNPFTSLSPSDCPFPPNKQTGMHCLYVLDAFTAAILLLLSLNPVALKTILGVWDMRIIPEGKGEAFVNGTAMRAGQGSATEADEMTMKEAMRSLSFAYLAVAIEERFFSVSDSLQLGCFWEGFSKKMREGGQNGHVDGFKRVNLSLKYELAMRYRRALD